MNEKFELKIPPRAEVADRAFEIVRVWAADGQQHVSIATGLWRDPAAWGLALADLARHVANAYEQTQGIPATEALLRIREALDAEWKAPTDSPKGGLLD